MVRAFVDVFPQAVLLSGTQAELLLLGTNAPRLEIDPERMGQAIARSPEVQHDLARLDLGTPREIVGTFVGSADTLRGATRNVQAIADDRPIQEYAVRSELSTGLMGVPGALFDLSGVGEWCPRCVDDADGAPTIAGLDLYIGLMQEAYTASPAEVAAVAAASKGQRRLMGSAYLGAVVPDTAEVHNILGLDHLRNGRVVEAAGEFEEALSRDAQSPRARANLADVLYDEGAALLEARRFEEASAKLRKAIALAPGLVDAHNNLGVALASMGRVGDALPHFRRAVALAPSNAEARSNLAAAEATIGR
jgi:tetratricopeptide (TPR) repeat protein